MIIFFGHVVIVVFGQIYINIYKFEQLFNSSNIIVLETMCKLTWKSVLQANCIVHACIYVYVILYSCIYIFSIAICIENKSDSYGNK